MSTAYDFTFEVSAGELDYIFHQSPCSALVGLVVQHYGQNVYESDAVAPQRGLLAAVTEVRDMLMGQVEAFNKAIKYIDVDSDK